MVANVYTRIICIDKLCASRVVDSWAGYWYCGDNGLYAGGVRWNLCYQQSTINTMTTPIQNGN